jgi:hypothetical protein
MGSIGSITSTVQAVYSSAAARRVIAGSEAAPTRDADGDGDRSPPGGSIWSPGKGNVIDVYA